MNYVKITTGRVKQIFNDNGEFLSQTFIAANDDVIYETEDGDSINVMDMPLGGREYHPFEIEKEDIEVEQKTTDLHKLSGAFEENTYL